MDVGCDCLRFGFDCGSGAALRPPDLHPHAAADRTHLSDAAARADLHAITDADVDAAFARLHAHTDPFDFAYAGDGDVRIRALQRTRRVGDSRERIARLLAQQSARPNRDRHA